MDSIVDVEPLLGYYYMIGLEVMGVKRIHPSLGHSQAPWIVGCSPKQPASTTTTASN